MEISEFMGSFIGDLESGKRLKFRSSCPVSSGYIMNIRSAFTRLKEFEKRQEHSYLLDEVDMEFRQEFVGFLVNKGLKPNTIKTRMAAIHVVMREAYISGLTHNEGFSDPDFIPLAEAVDSVYLTDEQIASLRNLEIKGDYYPQMLRVLEWTRDLFIVGCITGQRFSDYSRINYSMLTYICGRKFIKLKQKKTGAEVIIPMNRELEEILDKYNGVLPHVALATFNRNMRILGEMMGWTWVPDSLHTQDSTHKRRFCDMLSSHTARRSFATNAYQRGVPIKSIMAVTGHRSERSLRLYLRLDTRDKALMAARDFGRFLQIATR